MISIFLIRKDITGCYGISYTLPSQKGSKINTEVFILIPNIGAAEEGFVGGIAAARLFYSDAAARCVRGNTLVFRYVNASYICLELVSVKQITGIHFLQHITDVVGYTVGNNYV